MTAADPEKRPTTDRALRLGYVPLIDCAPIVVAREKGLFEKHGLAVLTSQEPGWATVRDKLVHDELDAAHCLGPLAIAIHHGIGTLARPMVVPLVLSANGNAITLSQRIPADIFSQKKGLLKYLEDNHRRDKPLTLATVHPCSSHHELLRLWLQKNQVLGHPALNLITLPPELMGRNLAHEHIDGFCVGEPWNSAALLEGTGWVAATSLDLARGHPEKVLAVSGALAEQQPSRIEALTAALLEACRFCQEEAHHAEIVDLLACEPGLEKVAHALPYSLSGRLPASDPHPGQTVPDFHLFHSPGINSPGSETASWLREALRHSGLLKKGQELAPDELFQPQRHDQALASLG
ncbi:CmpA/NrtA family ABC transporter substrate-binding protein [Roseibacillus ishigakijimensis]|uniref:CmpA/NrtA family ABC transporter substrate-binding protein n=1 Tax=Roseibacillus ishigakijimensis TaxID=454146 RepID=UPI001908FDFC|nr:CmpA/NrtA family ABC transporter substrate-binding protein [Roseibacillus ishigakijimensis]